MASKLLPLLATLLLGLAHVTTATSVGGGRWSTAAVTEECRREVKSRDMSPCAEFLSEQDRKPFYGEDPTLSGRGSRHFYRCCDELRSIDNYQCRCDGLRLQIEKLRGPPEEMGGAGVMVGTADILPRMCGVGPDTCRFQSSWF